MKLKMMTLVLASAAILSGATTTYADAVVPNFVVPSFVGQPNTTYQQWHKFLTGSLAGPNAPLSGYTNPHGAPNVFDATHATDGAFITGGGNMYSPGGAITPTITVPSANLGDQWQTQIVLQTQTLGSVIDFTQVKVTPAGGSPVVVSPADIQLLGSIPLGGFGGSQDDYKFVWTLPGNASSYTISFTTATSSLSFAGARVDTLATPLAAVPEPASMALLGTAAVLLMARRKKHG